MPWGRMSFRFVGIVPLVLGCGGSTLTTPKDDGAPSAGKTGQACPGADDVGGGARCRDSDECSGDEICQAYLPYPCSNGFNSCYQDAECGAGLLCVASGLNSCLSGGGLNICGAPCTAESCTEGSRCEADGRCGPTPCLEGYACPSDLLCASDGEAQTDEHGCRVASCESGEYTCPAGFECDPTEQAADRNGCLPISCVAGYECPANQRCVPGTPTLHAHQCERLECERDSDCDCGYCIENTCRDALSFCAPPPIG